MFPLRSQPLPDSTIHIWCASLSDSTLNLAHCISLLSPDEKERSNRFHFLEDQNRYILGRGLLRTILGSYLGIEPAKIEFVYGKYGKPAIKSQHQDHALEFNLAHSKDMIIYAMGCHIQMGIDIEYIHPMPDMDNFAKHFFSANEYKLISSLSERQKENAFFKLWVSKESFLKAHGSGLTTSLDQVEISLTGDGSAKLESIEKNKVEANSWNLELFTPLPDYQAALSVRGHSNQILFRDLIDLHG